ncbi:MAG TPA: hypothetical protein VJM11_07955 [Nevskiaceae bacterium]|nr:hypothetical protein [Nevskiaceae bacterium]
MSSGHGKKAHPECGCEVLRLESVAVFRPQSIYRLPPAEQDMKRGIRRFACCVCGGQWEWTQPTGWRPKRG